MSSGPPPSRRGWRNFAAFSNQIAFEGPFASQLRISNYFISNLCPFLSMSYVSFTFSLIHHLSRFRVLLKIYRKILPRKSQHHVFQKFVLKENYFIQKMCISENVAVISQEYVQMVDSFENFNLNCMYVFTLVIDFIQCFTFCLFIEKYG